MISCNMYDEKVEYRLQFCAFFTVLVFQSLHLSPKNEGKISHWQFMEIKNNEITRVCPADKRGCCVRMNDYFIAVTIG